MWFDRKGVSGVFKQLSISYHIALKKLLYIPKYFSNHYVCDALNLLTFDHFMNLKLLKFYFWLYNCESPCFCHHKCYFLKFSNIKKSIDKIGYKEYNVANIFDNDIDAIVSRMFYIQNMEPSSWFLIL